MTLFSKLSLFCFFCLFNGLWSLFRRDVNMWKACCFVRIRANSILPKKNSSQKGQSGRLFLKMHDSGKIQTRQQNKLLFCFLEWWFFKIKFNFLWISFLRFTAPMNPSSIFISILFFRIPTYFNFFDLRSLMEPTKVKADFLNMKVSRKTNRSK